MIAPLLEDLGSRERFPLNRHGWPGRELYWCWRNPLLTIVILGSAVAELLRVVFT